jgi:hypothetical protein
MKYNYERETKTGDRDKAQETALGPVVEPRKIQDVS